MPYVFVASDLVEYRCYADIRVPRVKISHRSVESRAAILQQIAYKSRKRKAMRVLIIDEEEVNRSKRRTNAFSFFFLLLYCLCLIFFFSFFLFSSLIYIYIYIHTYIYVYIRTCLHIRISSLLFSSHKPFALARNRAKQHDRYESDISFLWHLYIIIYAHARENNLNITESLLSMFSLYLSPSSFYSFPPFNFYCLGTTSPSSQSSQKGGRERGE